MRNWIKAVGIFVGGVSIVEAITWLASNHASVMFWGVVTLFIFLAIWAIKNLLDSLDKT